MTIPTTPSTTIASDHQQAQQMVEQIRTWGHELGFQHVAISDLQLVEHSERLQQWLAQQFHGEMSYMERHSALRSDPQQLLPGTVRVITVRLDYRPPDDAPQSVLDNPEQGYIARYALGRDYHKLMRKRLAKLASEIDQKLAGHEYRAFVDSAPVLERALAERSGQGWIGKNTMLINAKAGSWFFLGEIYTNLPLPADPPQEQMHCGSCQACLDICPTQAIIAPFQLDARRCISYLTIEHHGPIPVELRAAMGNRIYGCDDCQLCCPWNKFSAPTAEVDFLPRHNLDQPALLDLFEWDEETFLSRTEGSPIRRIGHQRWLRNIAVALGNAPANPEVVSALEQRLADASEMLKEHIEWALARQRERS